MFSKNHPIILFIDRNSFSLFQDTQSNISKFNFTPDIVANLDVVNKDQFLSLIATFIQINKIVPSSLIVVLSDKIIYVKDLVGDSNPLAPLNSVNSEYRGEIQNFLDNIPFEEILAKVIKTDKTGRIVAVNKDLVMTIADAFVNKGSVLDAVIPSFLYGSNVNFASGLTEDNIQAILNGSEIVRVGNLLTGQKEIISSFPLANAKPKSLTLPDLASREKKPQSLRQYILIGVFVTLLVILTVVYLNLGASQTPPSVKTN